MTVMTRGNFHFYAEGLARHLGKIRSESWAAINLDPESYGRLGVDLAIARGRARLHVSIVRGRLVVEGKGPEGYHLARTWRRTFALGDNGWPAWDSLRIAREVDHHIISAGYADDLLAVTARKDEADRKTSERSALMARAAVLFGIEPPAAQRDMQRNRDAHELKLGEFVKGKGSVKPSYDQGCLDINLTGIPAQVALDMLAVLAKSAGANCCYRYGPGHHPDFASASCLREKSERGKQASELRAHALLAEHGASRPAVDDALDEAGTEGAGLVMDLGQVLAVVSFDQGGKGEYTVELSKARKEATA